MRQGSCEISEVHVFLPAQNRLLVCTGGISPWWESRWPKQWSSSTRARPPRAGSSSHRRTEQVSSQSSQTAEWTAVQKDNLVTVLLLARKEFNCSLEKDTRKSDFGSVARKAIRICAENPQWSITGTDHDKQWTEELPADSPPDPRSLPQHGRDIVEEPVSTCRKQRHLRNCTCFKKAVRLFCFWDAWNTTYRTPSPVQCIQRGQLSGWPILHSKCPSIAACTHLPEEIFGFSAWHSCWKNILTVERADFCRYRSILTSQHRGKPSRKKVVHTMRMILVLCGLIHLNWSSRDVKTVSSIANWKRFKTPNRKT